MTEFISSGAGGFLFTLIWKGSVILALATLASMLLWEASAAARHWIWFLGVSGLLVLPLAETVTPRWDVALPESWSARSAPGDAGRSPTPRAARPEESGPRLAPLAPRAATGPAVAVAPAPAAHVASPRVPLSSSESPVESSYPALSLLLLVWAAGTLCLLTSLATSWIAVARLEGGAGRFGDKHLEALATGLAARLGVRKPVRLLRGAPDAMPMSWGILRPVVLLPAGAQRWERHRLASVLLHELAHVRRRDCLTQLVAEVALALYWPNPLAWLAARRLRVEREHACDDLVLSAGARPSEYALELLALAQDLGATRRSALAAVAMARPVHLGPRLKALFEERSRRTLRLRSTALTSAATAACILVLGAFTPTAAAGPASVGPRERAASARPTEDNASLRARTPSPSSSTPFAPWAQTASRSLQVVSCGLASDGWRRTSHQSDDDEHRLTWSRPGCEVDVRVEGDVEFSGDFRDVARLGRDALLRIEEEDGDTERRLDVQPGARGEVTYAYMLDGRAAEFDAEARIWYEAMLLQVFRRGGFMAEERVASILRSGGTGAVLQELEEIPSDHVFASYAQALLERAELTDQEAVSLVGRARDRVDSDHYLAGVLEAMADRHLDSPTVLDAFLEASRAIESDHYRAGVLGRALRAQNLSSAQVGSLLASASAIDSDHYLAELLREVGARYALQPELRAEYLLAVESIESDHYRAEVLSALLQRTDLDAPELIVVLRAAGAISSDHYQSEILMQVARGGTPAAEVRRAAIALSSQIDSDHYRSAVLREFLPEGAIGEPELRDLISAAREIGSDHYKAEVLTAIARGRPIEGETRDLFLDAVQSIRSSHYRGEVADVLLREGRGGD